MFRKHNKRRRFRTVVWWCLGLMAALFLVAALRPPLNILVLGLDGHGGDGSRSDTIAVVSVHPLRGRVHLLSIPRDTQVELPDYGWEKAAHAHAYGGVPLARAAVSDLLGVTIHRVAIVNVDTFAALVDLVGGVTLNVEAPMHYHDPYQNLNIALEPGEQRLSGEQAMHYVRYRSDGGDIPRIGRQQEFLQALTREVLRPANIPKWPAFASASLAALETDLNAFDLAALLGAGLRSAASGFETAVLPGQPGTGSDGLWYWFPDPAGVEAAAAALYAR